MIFTDTKHSTTPKKYFQDLVQMCRIGRANMLIGTYNTKANVTKYFIGTYDIEHKHFSIPMNKWMYQGRSG